MASTNANDIESKALANIYALCSLLWDESHADRSKIARLGHAELGGYGIEVGLLIEIDQRMDILAGIVTTLIKRGVFPSKHWIEIEKLEIAEDPIIIKWIAEFGDEMPKYMNYILCVDALCGALKKFYLRKCST